MSKISPRWWVVFLLFSGTFINAIDRSSLSSAETVLMKELHLDSAQMGIVLSAFFWFYMLMNIPFGNLADKYGAKMALGMASLIWSVSSALTGVASKFWTLICARAGVGIGESACFPVNAKIVNQSFAAHERGMVTGLYSCGLRLGFGVTPLLMARLIDRFGWRVSFYATGLGSLAWVGLWYATYRMDDTGTKSREAEAVSQKIPWRELLRHRTVQGLVLSKFFQDYLFYLFVTWLPGYLVMNRGFSILKMGSFAALPWIGGTIMQPVIGWISDTLIRKGVSPTVSRKSIMVLMHFLAASVIIAAYARDAMVAVALLTLSVSAESAAASVLWTTCADVAPRGAGGSLGGIKNTAGALAGILAPVVTGYIVKVTGSFDLALALGGCMVICAAVSVLFVMGEIKPIELNTQVPKDPNTQGNLKPQLPNSSAQDF